MAVVLDTNYLIAWLQPTNLAVPIDPATNSAIVRLEERVEFLIAELQKSGERIVVPTPALTEFLVGAGKAGATLLAQLAKNKNFRIADFGRRAAIEAAEIIRSARQGGKAGFAPDTWPKAKFDMQIAAIAKVENATRVYTSDQGLANRCRHIGLAPIAFHELPLPGDDAAPLLKWAANQPDGDDGL